MIITIIFAMLVWVYGAGPFLLAFNAIAHSETNCLLNNAKFDGESTIKLRIYQVLHCTGYFVWGVVFVSIPFIIKHFFY